MYMDIFDYCFNLTSLTTCLVLQSHTILLVQPTKRPEGRTYADYESVNECMEGELIDHLNVCLFC